MQITETKIQTLSETHPGLADEWNYEKNKDEPDKYNKESKDNVWWKCARGHEWEAKITNRVKGSSCRQCKYFEIPYEESLEYIFPELMEEWHHELNTEFGPHEVTPGSSREVYWKCKEYGDIYSSEIKKRTNAKNPRGCPYCAGQKTNKRTCLQTKNPKLSKEWCYEKNGELTPKDVTEFSSEKVYWKCMNNPEHEPWIATIKSRSLGTGCPTCAGQVPTEYNNLARVREDVAKEWHPTKNGNLKPDKVLPNSKLKVWWKCEKGHVWPARISSRTSGNTKCGKCNGGYQSSEPEMFVYYHIKKHFPRAINRYKLPVDGRAVELDVFIPELNIGVEYDGEYYHKDKLKKDLEKNKKTRNLLNRELLRIRESKLKSEKFKKGSVFKVKKGDYKSLEKGIKNLLINLGVKDEKIQIEYKKDIKEVNKLTEFVKKEKSLLIIRPDIAEDWCYKKNGNLEPIHVTPGSRKMVHWVCKHGHSLDRTVYQRVRTNGCTTCNKKKRAK